MPNRNVLPFLKYLARYRALLFHIDLLEQAAQTLGGDLQDQMRTYVQRQLVIKRWLRREIFLLGREVGIRERDLPI